MRASDDNAITVSYGSFSVTCLGMKTRLKC